MRDGAIVFASMTFINVLNYGIHFILSRGLGVDNYAAFGSMISALAIVGIPAAFMTLVVVKYVAEFHALEEGARIRILSQRMLLVGAGAGGAGQIFICRNGSCTVKRNRTRASREGSCAGLGNITRGT